MLHAHAYISVLEDLKELLVQLKTEDYQKPVSVILGFSIGQHTRHILEFSECLFSGEETISYDKRKRNQKLETSIEAALEKLEESIKFSLSSPSKVIHVSTLVNPEENSYLTSKSTTEREIIYIMDHAIHHMAIIKIAVVSDFPEIKLSENFGFSHSTVRHLSISAGR